MRNKEIQSILARQLGCLADGTLFDWPVGKHTGLATSGGSVRISKTISKWTTDQIIARHVRNGLQSLVHVFVMTTASALQASKIKS